MIELEKLQELMFVSFEPSDNWLGWNLWYQHENYKKGDPSIIPEWFIIEIKKRLKMLAYTTMLEKNIRTVKYANYTIRCHANNPEMQDSCYVQIIFARLEGDYITTLNMVWNGELNLQ